MRLGMVLSRPEENSVSKSNKKELDEDVTIMNFDFSSKRDVPTGHELRNKGRMKGKEGRMFRQFSLEVVQKRSGVVYKYVFIGLLPMSIKKGTNHVVFLLDQAFKFLKKLEIELGLKFKKFLLICDGASSENRNKQLFLYLLQKRMREKFNYIDIQIGCPNEMNWSPDRYHSHCFYWYEKYSNLEKINIESYKQLVRLGNEIIAPNVAGDGMEITRIEFFDLDDLEHLTMNYSKTGKFTWVDSDIPNAVFPDDFIPADKVRRQHKTIYYLNKFYRSSLYYKLYYTTQSVITLFILLWPKLYYDYVTQSRTSVS